jgi:hypothetical protein
VDLLKVTGLAFCYFTISISTSNIEEISLGMEGALKNEESIIPLERIIIIIKGYQF